MFGFLIPYIDWSLVIGLTSAASIFAGAWLRNKQIARAEVNDATRMEQRFSDLRHDIGSLELKVETIEGIVQKHGESLGRR
ncbi:hypothetical protein LCGC14_2354700 [marine sediment metagenome]|uniref:Uncharacterized protein n=1 Tax=marine sediment metagenome TaxID=412755 RepID=A0A0F9C8N8_9ZZZZ